ncbi:hypothetical protein IKR55_00410 [bacterium]|nr:hypothetical protein [Elusimicrobiota bacterium]MBR6301178.1 hypothetical protein [bacterium]
MSKFILVKDKKFGKLKCDVWQSGEDFFMTREQIGKALGYKNPKKSISDIHNRHKERMDKFSTVRKTQTVDGRERETFLYSTRGVYEICRWSNQPKANDFYDFVYELLEGLRKGYLKVQAEKQNLAWQQTRQLGKLARREETDAIKKFIEYAKAQGSKNADRYYVHFSKLANKLAGIHGNMRDLISGKQLMYLSIAESSIVKTVTEGMKQNLDRHSIYKLCKSRLDILTDIAIIPESNCKMQITSEGS